MERISHSLSSDVTPGISNFIWAKVTQLSESYKNPFTYLFILAALHGLRDLSSLTRD